MSSQLWVNSREDLALNLFGNQSRTTLNLKLVGCRASNPAPEKTTCYENHSSTVLWYCNCILHKRSIGLKTTVFIQLFVLNTYHINHTTLVQYSEYSHHKGLPFSFIFIIMIFLIFALIRQFINFSRNGNYSSILSLVIYNYTIIRLI